jgi:hypothetical protein
LLLVVIVAALFQTVAPASAQESTPPSLPPQPGASSTASDDPSKAFEFYPADTGWGTFFAPEIAAGSSIELKAITANVGTVTQRLRIFPLNAFTAEGGGFAAGNYGDEPTDVTRWIELEEQVETIDPGAGIETTFTVAVPDGTKPGEYLAAVAAEQADPSEVEGTTEITQTLRYVVPVMITVPGPTTTDFSVGDVSIVRDGAVLLIQVPIVNAGDVRVRPEGTIELRDSEGALLATVPVAMESVYARDATTLTVGITAPSSATGPFQVHVDLKDQGSGFVATAEASGLEIEAVGTSSEVLITFTTASIAPAPSANDVQFATVSAVITNSGEPIANGQLSLIASVDGEEIERFPISQALSLQSGETAIETRYIPVTGWTSGEWTFEILLETVDPTGTAVVIARQQLEGTITIP